MSGTGNWRYVDCVSAQGGKLAALEHVRRLFNVPRSRTVAAGDSGNDILMLDGEPPSGWSGSSLVLHAQLTGACWVQARTLRSWWATRSLRCWTGWCSSRRTGASCSRALSQQGASSRVWPVLGCSRCRQMDVSRQRR